ncbi:SDR family oxidoreductase [Flaviaesturariibacter amylovorans]|uniref:SDR family oxidoreductase n=1 Tax=Flaviaesturariibacter amylovorans TaxID=1084520 RepID=A0ABP8HNS5_9BACT
MEKKVILVTGTNSGFGRRYAATLSAAGHLVYATMRDADGRNAEAAADLRQLPGVRVLELELADAASVQRAVHTVVEEQGRIDVLINNAGTFSGGLAETFTDADVERLFDVHLKGTWRAIREVLPHMRRQGEGLIINTSSVLGRFSSPFMAFYNSAKFAVEGLTESLHYEVRPLGVDVVLLQPGAFPTDIFSKAGKGSDESVAAAYGALADVPAQIGAGIAQLFETVKPDPQEVADAVLRLVETPKGKRPLRTVVDRVTGAHVEAANEKVSEGYREFVSAFGLGALLQ